MSQALYNVNSLRFWTQREIMLRNQFADRIVSNVLKSLMDINPAWRIEQCEGPLLTPRPEISAAYDASDVFLLQAKLGDEEAVMRPETTPSSYAYAKHLMRVGSHKLPMIVWQIGKSFRRETSDGATAAKLRFNEFYQLEMQCIYRADSHADYRKAVITNLEKELTECSGKESRIIPSDRLPSYSEQTDDIELIWKKDFKEVCSVSTRTDFSVKGFPDLKVLEIAVGMDRLVCIKEGTL